jgi:hypothetical protein
MAGNVKLIPSLRKSLRARAMDRCLPTLETSKNLTVNQEVAGSNPAAPVFSSNVPSDAGWTAGHGAVLSRSSPQGLPPHAPDFPARRRVSDRCLRP